VELYLHTSDKHSWRGAQLKKHRDSFTLPYCLQQNGVGRTSGFQGTLYQQENG